MLHYNIFLAVLKLKSHCINKTQLFIVIKETHLVVVSNQMFSLKTFCLLKDMSTVCLNEKEHTCSYF